MSGKQQEQSEHEALVRLFSEHSFGAPFIFAPSQWSKGNAVREPSDLAWICNDCAILMYACKTRRVEKAIKHNLTQAKGWLREWRRGRPLVGENSYKTFSVQYSQVSHVVLLSIADTPDAVARCQSPEADELGVTVCATLPSSALRKLAEMMASPVDLLNILAMLREVNKTDGDLSQASINQLVKDYQWVSWQQSGALIQWPDKIDDDFLRLQYPLYGMRLPIRNDKPDGGKVLTPPSGGSGLEGAALFNDLALEDLLKLFVSMERLDTIVRADRPTREAWGIPSPPPGVGIAVFGPVRLAYYDFTLAVSQNTTQFTPGIENVVALAKTVSRHGPEEFGPIIVYCRDPGITTFMVNPRKYPSHMQTVLDVWHQPYCNEPRSLGQI